MRTLLGFTLAVAVYPFIFLELTAADPGSAVTNPLGFVRITAEAGKLTPIGISVVNQPLGGGTIEAVDGDKITLNVELSVPGVKPSYLEITDQGSSFVGDRFDVISVNGTTVHMDLSPNSHSTIRGSLPDSLVGATIVYRNHVTLGQLEDWLPEGSEFVRSFFSGSADSLTLYRDGLTVQYHYSLSGVWSRTGVSDASGVVLEPGQGLLFYRQAAADDLVFIVPGSVRTNDFRQNFRKGVNLLATGYPVDVSFEDRGFIKENGFRASFFMAQADQVLLYADDGAFISYYLRDASNWGEPFGFLFDATSAVFLQKQEDDFNFFSPLPY